MRLSKRAVESLLDGYDADPIGALTVALRIVLGLPGATWPELVTAGPFEASRRAALLAADQYTLDALLTQLNETRTAIE